MIKASIAMGRRPRLSVRSVNKLQMANTQNVIFRVQGMNQTCSAVGGYAQLGLVGNGTNFWPPIALCDVTSISAPAIVHNPCFYLQRNNATARYSVYNEWKAQDSGGASALHSYWTIEQASDPNALGGATGSLIKGSVLDWVSIRLMLYGSLTRPTTFNVMLVSFKRKWVDPLELQQNAATLADDNDAAGFWESIAKPLSYNPLDLQNPKYRKYMKVLKRHTVCLQPKLTTEAQVDGASVSAGTYVPHMEQLNFFWRANRKQNYAWFPQDSANPNTGILNNAAYQTVGSQAQSVVAPRARVYLMITANVAVQSASGAGNPTGAPITLTDPSFDYVIRTKHRILNN